MTLTLRLTAAADEIDKFVATWQQAKTNNLKQFCWFLAACM